MDSSETVQRTLEDLLQSQSLQIPIVKRVGNLTRIIYVSAIAHPVAVQAQLPVEIVAAELVPLLRLQLQQSEGFLGLPISLAAQSTLKVEPTQSGLIQIEFSDRTIAFWLQDLLASAMVPMPLDACPKLLFAAIFAAQHSHARCCSLLRLAHSEKLIALQNLELTPINWQLQLPDFPYLYPDLHPDQGQLSQPACQLLGNLFNLWEALFRSIQRPNKLLTTAHQSFQQFHRDVPPFSQPPDPTQWLLLLATQRILHRLLEKFQLPIPAEL